MSELEVVLEQLDELLATGVEDEDDALEVAVLAGTAARLGAGEAALQDAVDWRDGPGSDLVEVAFEDLDLDALLEAIDGVLQGDADEEAVEEAVYEFDDVVAAAVWTGRQDVVRDAARVVAETVRQVPEPFASLADFGAEMIRLPTVAEEAELYDYWRAVAEAAQWAEEQESTE